MPPPQRTRFGRWRRRESNPPGRDIPSQPGLQALEAHWVTARQIEAGRIAAQHFLRRQGKVYIRVFPDKPVSKKPLETRMGKGKADTDFWAARVKPGTMLYEIAGVPENLAKEALARIAHKMPVRCRFVGRRLAV